MCSRPAKYNRPWTEVDALLSQIWTQLSKNGDHCWSTLQSLEQPHNDKLRLEIESHASLEGKLQRFLEIGSADRKQPELTIGLHKLFVEVAKCLCDGYVLDWEERKAYRVKLLEDVKTERKESIWPSCDLD